MPAYLTHKLAATAAHKIMPDPEIKRIVGENFTDYLSGAQGGDSVYFRHFYFLFLYAKTKVYGWLIHRARPSEYLTAATKYVRENYTEKLLAYFCGFLNHYCLDKYLHPLVHHDTRNISTHTYLEQALDVMYADKFFGIDATNISREKELLELVGDTAGIYEFHKYMAAAIYDGYKLPRGSFDKSYWWWSRVARMTDQPGRARRFWLAIYNVFLPFDIIAFIYKTKNEVETLYDYDKYYRAIEKSNEECLSRTQLVYEFVRGMHEPNVLESAFLNVNCLGLPVIPWSERRAFRQAYRRAPVKE